MTGGRRRGTRATRSGWDVPFAAKVGEVTLLSLRIVRGTPRALGYSGEVIRQTGILITGSAIVIMVVTFFAGESCGLETAFVARALSVPSFGPGASYVCSVVFIVPFLFGFVLAAKVGCGFVAEIGAMRVREEVDALEVLGIRTVVYLLSVRLLAAAVAMPIIYSLAILSAEFGGYIESFTRFHDVSRGTYALYWDAFSVPNDLLISIGQGLTISAVVMCVALYFGYTVRGGPVEVGTATARSMAVNLVLITLVNLVYVLMFLLTARVPVA